MWDLFSYEGVGEKSESKYSKSTRTMHYKPTGNKPALVDMVDTSKYTNLVREIEKSNVSDDVKEFLKLAATRHIQFNYENIAEYYCHSDKDVQKLFEDSALVIIDFNDAIQNGYVELDKYISGLMEGVSNEN